MRWRGKGERMKLRDTREEGKGKEGRGRRGEKWERGPKRNKYKEQRKTKTPT